MYLVQKSPVWPFICRAFALLLSACWSEDIWICCKRIAPDVVPLGIDADMLPSYSTRVIVSRASIQIHWSAQTTKKLKIETLKKVEFRAKRLIILCLDGCSNCNAVATGKKTSTEEQHRRVTQNTKTEEQNRSTFVRHAMHTKMRVLYSFCGQWSLSKCQTMLKFDAAKFINRLLLDLVPALPLWSLFLSEYTRDPIINQPKLPSDGTLSRSANTSCNMIHIIWNTWRREVKNNQNEDTDSLESLSNREIERDSPKIKTHEINRFKWDRKQCMEVPCWWNTLEWSSSIVAL